MDNFNAFWNSFEKTADDKGGPESPSEEVAESDHINPRSDYWDMLADGSLVTKPMGSLPGGRVVVSAPGTCEHCDSARSRNEFTGPGHRGPICDSNCPDHHTGSGHY